MTRTLLVQTFNREASSKMYSTVVFAIAQLVSEIPYSILCAVAFYLLFCECTADRYVVDTIPVD